MRLQPLFRFAVLADSHVNPSEAELISPFESHRQTNARLRHVVDALNQLEPAFSIHVGDMVHPVPEAVSYSQAVEQFKAAISELHHPVHLVPGNHDIGDKRADYVPAGVIREEYVRQYSEHFGAHFYSFDVRGCHFVVINSSLLNSGLADEAMQRAWLLEDIRRHAGKRIFLFTHYPPFIAAADEPGHYDNIDEPGRSWLLGVIETHGISAVFTGHVHNFFYNRIGGTDIISMPSTAFVRADYTEMFRVGQPPENENGRNDIAKLGVMLVEVYEDGIVPQFIRTYEGAGARRQPAQRYWPALHPGAGDTPSLGLDLRYAWAETAEVPYSSMLDEFRRKKARNDYPILSLWEMGIRRIRVPLDDLLDADTRARVVAMAAHGSRFTVFRFGVPSLAEVEILRQHAHCVSALEIILKWPLEQGTAAMLADIRRQVRRPLFISKFWNATGQSKDGKQIKLLVDHGFEAGTGTMDTALPDAEPVRAVDGLVFRVSRATPARTGIRSAVESARQLALRAQVHLRLANDSPAVAENDEWSNAMRMLEGAVCSLYYKDATIFLDTFSDVDRGYFPRAGLVDRRFNPRLGSKLLRTFNGAILPVAADIKNLEWCECEEALVAILDGGARSLAVIMPHKEGAIDSLTGCPTLLARANARIKITDLVHGGESETGTASGDSRTCLYFDEPLRHPALLELY
jgi:predicted phosphodiesterase